MNKRLLNLLNGRPELLKYVKQSRNMERKKMAWNLIVNQKKYANMDLEWYKSKEAYAILKKVLMKLVEEQLGGMGILSCFGPNCNPEEKEQKEEAKVILDMSIPFTSRAKLRSMTWLYESLKRYPNEKLESNEKLMKILEDNKPSILAYIEDKKQKSRDLDEQANRLTKQYMEEAAKKTLSKFPSAPTHRI